jgi:hypothetical protein
LLEDLKNKETEVVKGVFGKLLQQKVDGVTWEEMLVVFPLMKK